ncbi:MAG TPA: iron-containing alcohol dehydrogenase [Pirellulaceae bacterium]|nr:iron-containing alcohol dehydrogenase [Pirellulaceae bacterium]
MRTTWNFHTAGQLTFGRGAVREVGRLAVRRGLRRVLIVTDPLLVRVGILEQVRQPLLDAGVAVDVFDGGEPEPSVDAALRAIGQARAFRPDAVLGLGGGSNMDLAKVAANVYTHGGTPHDYFGWDRVPGPVTPLICVPTTAGTGSEVSHAAVVTDTAAHLKVSTLSQHLRPALALVDPELTYSCPPKVTADSGIDALTHAIEAYIATDYDRLPLAPGETSAYEGRFPLGECLAEKAIQLVGKHLVAAVREPKNAEARDGMALAATIAGIAFSNCAVAVVHALEYPLGGVLHCSHGAGNGLLLPFVMEFNLPERKVEFGRIAHLLGEDVSGLSVDDAARRAIVAVEKLKTAIGIPQRIRDLGGTREQLPAFAEKAFGIKRLMMMNPRQPTQADLLGILEAAF